MRLVLCPDYILSRSDNDVHFIDAPTLARLYRVPYRNCIIKNERYRHQQGDVMLWPRYDGDYSKLPVPVSTVEPKGGP